MNKFFFSFFKCRKCLFLFFGQRFTPYDSDLFVIIFVYSGVFLTATQSKQGCLTTYTLSSCFVPCDNKSLHKDTNKDVLYQIFLSFFHPPQYTYLTRLLYPSINRQQLFRLILKKKAKRELMIFKKQQYKYTHTLEKC